MAKMDEMKERVRTASEERQERQKARDATTGLVVGRLHSELEREEEVIAEFRGLNGSLEHVISWNAEPALAAEVIVQELRALFRAVKEGFPLEKGIDELHDNQVEEMTTYECWRHNSTGYFDNAVREAQARGRVLLLRMLREARAAFGSLEKEEVDTEVVVKGLLRYSFRDASGFEALTDEERGIVGSSQNFEVLKKWAGNEEEA